MTPPFDAELLLRHHGGALRSLAQQLLRDRNEIDDAVQETWLRALRSPPRHGDGLGAWLAKVLHNVVRRAGRASARRRRHEDAAIALARTDSEDHAVAFEHADMARRLLAAVTGLEPPYREVVWARFFEGLAPREIASRRGVAVATVKSQLQRGLGKLRERLEEGGAEWRGAMGIAFGLGAEPLAAAGAASGGAGAGVVIGGGVLMATWMKGVVVGVAMAAVACVVWWPREELQPQSLGRRDAVVAAVSAPAADSVSFRGERTDGANPGTAAKSVAANEPASVAAGTVRGRVVDAETKQPLAGVRVRRSDQPAAATVFTAADGSFVAAGRIGRDTRLALLGDHHVEVEWTGTVPAAAELDAGDLPMRRGRRVHGRVVDAAGQPVAVAGMLVTVEFEPQRAGAQRERNPDMRTDASGQFETPAIPLGDTVWRLPSFPTEPVVAMPEPLRIVLGLDEPREVVLRTQPRPSIRGIVVDERGQPVGGVPLGDQPGWVQSESDANGSFVLWRMRVADAATIHVGAAPGFAARAPLPDVAWGSEGVRIELRRLAPFRIEVVDPEGRPIERFGIAVQRPGLPPFAAGTVQQRGEHANGECVCADIERGKTALRVLPTEARWSPSTLLAIDDQDSLRVVMAPRRQLHALVTRGEQPAAGVEVRLVREFGATTSVPSSLVYDPQNGDRVWMSGSAAESVATAVTDAAGRAALLADADLEGCALWLRQDEGPVHIVRELPQRLRGAELRVEMAAFGRIEGHVELRGRGHDTVRIEIPRLQRAGAQAIAVASDGTFTVPSLPVGAHTIELAWYGVGVHTLAAQAVEVRAAAVTNLRFDVASIPFAAVRGTVRAAVALSPSLAIECWRVTAPGDLRCMAVLPVAADGSFTGADLLPGSYRLAFRIGGRAQIVPTLLDAVFDVRAGANEPWRLQWLPRSLRVRLQRPDGTTARGERVLLRCDGVTWPQVRMLAPLVEDELVLDPAPQLPVEFRSWADGAPWSAPVSMPTDRESAEATVVLPEGRR